VLNPKSGRAAPSSSRKCEWKELRDDGAHMRPSSQNHVFSPKPTKEQMRKRKRKRKRSPKKEAI
jgi:hypothetical protein